MSMNGTETTSPETTVRVLLDAQGLKVSQQEFEQFVRTYLAMRAGADRLYIPEARNEDPALIFDPRWD